MLHVYCARTHVFEGLSHGFNGNSLYLPFYHNKYFIPPCDCHECIHQTIYDQLVSGNLLWEDLPEDALVHPQEGVQEAPGAEREAGSGVSQTEDAAEPRCLVHWEYSS